MITGYRLWNQKIFHVLFFETTSLAEEIERGEKVARSVGGAVASASV